jgi:hypothetical protein
MADLLHRDEWPSAVAAYLLYRHAAANAERGQDRLMIAAATGLMNPRHARPPGTGALMPHQPGPYLPAVRPMRRMDWRTLGLSG